MVLRPPSSPTPQLSHFIKRKRDAGTMICRILACDNAWEWGAIHRCQATLSGKRKETHLHECCKRSMQDNLSMLVDTLSANSASLITCQHACYFAGSSRSFWELSTLSLTWHCHWFSKTTSKPANFVYILASGSLELNYISETQQYSSATALHKSSA